MKLNLYPTPQAATKPGITYAIKNPKLLPLIISMFIPLNSDGDFKLFSGNWEWVFVVVKLEGCGWVDLGSCGWGNVLVEIVTERADYVLVHN